MRITYLIIAAITWLVYHLASAARAAMSLNFSFGLPGGFALRGASVQFFQPVTLLNRSGSDLTISQIDLDILSKTGSYLGRAYMYVPTVIPAYREATLNISATISFLDLLSAFPDLRNAVVTKQIDVQYKGNVQAAGIRINVDDRFQLSIPKF